MASYRFPHRSLCKLLEKIGTLQNFAHLCKARCHPKCVYWGKKEKRKKIEVLLQDQIMVYHVAFHAFLSSIFSLGISHAEISANNNFPYSLVKLPRTCIFYSLRTCKMG